MGYNNCNFSGVCTKEPKLLRSKDGVTYAMFTIVVTKRIYDNAVNRFTNVTSTVDICAFDGQATYVSKYVHRGSKLSVTTTFMQSEIRDAAGKLKTIPIFKLDDIDILSYGDEDWHSSKWI